MQYDEFGDDVSKLFLFTARVQSSRENAKVAYYHNNSIMVVGFPGDEGELLLESSTYTLTARFNLSFCGPGFEFHNESLKCACSKNYKSIQCENESAAIASNYWAGYMNDTTPDHLLTGLCVTELCNPNNRDHGQPTCNLPPMADEQALEKQINFVETVDMADCAGDAITTRLYIIIQQATLVETTPAVVMVYRSI